MVLKTKLHQTHIFKTNYMYCKIKCILVYKHIMYKRIFYEQACPFMFRDSGNEHHNVLIKPKKVKSEVIGVYFKSK